MFVLLILHIIKGKRKYSFAIIKNEMVIKLVHKIKYLIAFFLFLLLVSSTIVSNDDINTENLSFEIIKKNSSIGFINIEKTSFNKTTTYTITSELQARVIFKFNAIGLEKSVYKNDTLIYSSMYRKINGRVKLNHSLTLKNGKYFLKNKSKKENEVNIGVIQENLVTLFFEEPKNIEQIYSDKFVKKVKVNSLGMNTYKVKLPNKSVSIYHYKNGNCVQITIQGTFYKIKLIKTS